MAKTRPGKRDLDSYTIRGTNKVVKAGDCVLMRPPESGTASYVARVEKIEADNRNNVKVRVRWYYRPEESMGGRRQFHGAKELFLSDHYDVQSADTIEGKCSVHTFRAYVKLQNVGTEDYYCRFEYHPVCVGMSVEQTKQLDQFVCSDCASDQNVKKPQNSDDASRITSGKVEPKRQKR
ncbi:PREDICTED: chromatin remodeling protein EBS-like isoform X2 [Ipomoea nil]|uniref:chromatin remodeling protein EBS-like isoform X2 n=1 Tax=Ipomoea nil TaxID=35883 RepID=UPI000901E876|nr:PREDICTED: chromatin remodeling protein EBS-like isoform X2 [Ipomoea nil]